MDVELVTVGTELLLGFTVDTNSAEIGRALAAAGVRVVRRTAVSDDVAAIRDAVSAALKRTGAVITTGGRPTDERKSSRSTKLFGDCRMITMISLASAAISGAPPPPGSRTLGRS